MKNKRDESKNRSFEKELRKEYEQCVNCNLLEVIDYRNHKCYCSYMIKNKCILK